MELWILCHLCPGLHVQIVQTGSSQEDCIVGKIENTDSPAEHCEENRSHHTIFLKRINPSSETKCHFDALFWDQVGSDQ